VPEVAVEEAVSGQPEMAMVVLVQGAASLWRQSLSRPKKHSISMLVAVAEAVLVPLRSQVAVVAAAASLALREVPRNLSLPAAAAVEVEVITLQLLMAVQVA
jgi:hypothetical protein